MKTAGKILIRVAVLAVSVLIALVVIRQIGPARRAAGLPPPKKNFLGRVPFARTVAN